ncbi:ABC transporter, putative, partial [Bodo saltans]
MPPTPAPESSLEAAGEHHQKDNDGSSNPSHNDPVSSREQDDVPSASSPSAPSAPPPPSVFPRPSGSETPLNAFPGWSRYVVYWFVSPLVRFAHDSDRAMVVEDLWQLPESEAVLELYRRRFLPAWTASQLQRQQESRRRERNSVEASNDNASLLHMTDMYRALLRIDPPKVIFGAFCILIKVGCDLGIPILAREVLNSIQDDTMAGLYYSLGFIATLAVGQLCQQLHYRSMEMAASRMRAVCNFAIFEKAMDLRAYEVAAGTEGGAASSFSSSSPAKPSSGEGGDDKRKSNSSSTVVDMTARVVTLVASDSQRLVDVAPHVHLLWASLIQIGVGTYMMVLFLGNSSFAAVGLMLALFPISWKISVVQASIRHKLLPFTQRRVQQIAEFIQGVRVVKMYGWETYLRDTILSTHAVEMFYLRLELVLWVIVSTIMIIAPQVSLMVTFVIYVYARTDSTLNAADAFAALTMLGLLKFPVLYFGNATMMSSQAHVGCQRIMKFLTMGSNDIAATFEDNNINTELVPTTSTTSEEKNNNSNALPDVRLRESPSSAVGGEVYTDEEVVVNLSHVDIMWAPPLPTSSSPPQRTKSSVEPPTSSAVFQREEDDAKTEHVGATDIATTPLLTSSYVFAIRDLSFQLQRGEVCAVVGPVGSGKSLLCHALLGEAHCVATCADSNPIKAPASVAYAAQEPFLMSGSVRDNILFFRPFNEEKYREVLTACELWPDFAIYPDGELTVVGERGVTLSGGQKARIALARAVYARDCWLTILDDPFSALDTRTGAVIVDALLHPTKGLLRHQAVVIVTHARQHLSIAQVIVELHAEKSPRVIRVADFEGGAMSPSRLIDGDCLQDDEEEEDTTQRDPAAMDQAAVPP